MGSTGSTQIRLGQYESGNNVSDSDAMDTTIPRIDSDFSWDLDIRMRNKSNVTTTEEIPVFDIMTKQTRLKVAKLQSLIESGSVESENPIKVYKYRGKYILADGNHRVAAARELGITKIKAIVVDFDAADEKKSLARRLFSKLRK